MKSLQYFRSDNISPELLINAVFRNVRCWKIEVGIYEKVAKM